MKDIYELAAEMDKEATLSNTHLILKRPKPCSCCNRIHLSIPTAEAKSWPGQDMYIFNCTCNSTLILKHSDLKSPWLA